MVPQNPSTPDPAKPSGDSKTSAVSANGTALIAVPGHFGMRPGPVNLAASQPGSPETLSFFHTLARRWLLLVSLGSIPACLAGAVAWYILGSRYTAFAQVHIASHPYWTVLKEQEGRNDFPTYLQTQAGRIKSRYVANAALKREEVKKLDLYSRDPDPAGWLVDEIKVDFKEGSEFVTISMTGSDPDELTILVNAMAQAYLQEVVTTERKRLSERVAKLDELNNRAREKIRAKRQTWYNLVEKLGSSDSLALSQKQLITLNSYQQAEKQYSQIRLDLLKTKGRLAAYQARPKTAEEAFVPEAGITQALQSDAIAKEYLTRIAKLKDIIADYQRNAARADEITFIKAQNELKTVEKSLEDRRGELHEELRTLYQQQSKSQLEAVIEQLKEEIALLSEQEKPLQEEVERLAKEADKIGKSSTELDMLRQEIKEDEQRAEKIGNEFEALAIELGSPPRIHLDQEAALQRPNKKRQWLATVLVPLAAFLGLSFCVHWWDHRQGRIYSVKEVASGLGMRVMGTVPALPNSDPRRLLTLTDDPEWNGPNFLDSIDTVRTLLLREAQVDGTKVVMVTSAVEGEGKTTLASHLAGSLARAGRKTLVIDCDLRRPTLHQLFDVPLEPGFSEALLNEVEVTRAVQETATAGLFVLPAGQWDRQVMGTLAKEGVQKIFTELKQCFDFIIVDSHPVLTATDSLIIGQNADAVILSILRNRSQAQVVFTAYQRLASLGIRVAGTVVNGIQRHEMYGAGYQYLNTAVRS